MDRHPDLVHLYAVLASLEEHLGGKRVLAKYDGRMVWPRRGVYCLFESGEARSNARIGPRVVRIGTHALKIGSGTSPCNVSLSTVELSILVEAIIEARSSVRLSALRPRTATQWPFQCHGMSGVIPVPLLGRSA
jgi:hypothetical protein